MTLRQIFELTPPLKHSPKAEESELVAHIMDRLGCPLDEAVRAFNSMRHPNSGVLVYNVTDRVWTGSKWTPHLGTDELVRELVASHRVIVRHMDMARRAIRRLEKQVARLQRKVRSKAKHDIEDEEEEQEKPEQTPTGHQCMVCGRGSGEINGGIFRCCLCNSEYDLTTNNNDQQ
jgi:hypothetical protein